MVGDGREMDGRSLFLDAEGAHRGASLGEVDALDRPRVTNETKEVGEVEVIAYIWEGDGCMHLVHPRVTNETKEVGEVEVIACEIGGRCIGGEMHARAAQGSQGAIHCLR